MSSMLAPWPTRLSVAILLKPSCRASYGRIHAFFVWELALSGIEPTYATSRVFITRLDNGGTRVNISEVAGNMGVVAVTTLYYPDSRSASEAAERYGMALGNDAISNLLTEFWPDIKRRLPPLHHKA